MAFTLGADKLKKILCCVFVLFNLVLYYGFLMPAQQKIVALENRWRAERIEFKQTALYKRVREDLTRFKELLVEKEAVTKEVIGPLSETARQHHLRISTLDSEPARVAEHGQNRITFSLQVTGAYPDIRRFIHAIEIAPSFVIIEDMSLSRSSKEDSPRKLQVRMASYYR